MPPKGHRKGNIYNIDGNIVKGITTNNKEFIFDLEDLDLVKQYTWRWNKGYIESSIQIDYIDGKQISKSLVLSRLIMGLDTVDKFCVDHKDLNPSNNCKSNLRICTRQQNNCNTGSESDSIHSKFKGVTIHKKSGLYQVRISKNKKVVYNGYFKDEIEAAKAYNKAAKEFHGEFAYQNPISD